jgi:hypothetical protein
VKRGFVVKEKLLFGQNDPVADLTAFLSKTPPQPLSVQAAIMLTANQRSAQMLRAETRV